MKPHFIEIKDFETRSRIIIDMEGPYHPKNKRFGEHMYGATVLIDNIPYHFEKYIPTGKEVKRFKAENEGDVRFSKGRFPLSPCSIYEIVTVKPQRTTVAHSYRLAMSLRVMGIVVSTSPNFPFSNKNRR